MTFEQDENIFVRVKVHGREWKGFCLFCEKMGENPYEVCKKTVERHIRSEDRYVYTDPKSGNIISVVGTMDHTIEVTDEDSAKCSPHYWRLLQEKILLLLVSSASIIAANLLLKFIVTSHSVVSGYSITLQAIALVSCFVSFGGVSLASENHTGANRKIAIVISRWAEWGLFFIIALLMASVLMNGSWAAINYFLK